MKDLIAKLPEQYQDIEYQGKLYEGKRDCSLRWDLIKDHIRDGDVVMDLGSSLGYFSHKIAKERPNCLVVSFESESEMCAVQKKIYEDEGIYNVVVCQDRLTAKDVCQWIRHVDFFDVILALSVLHHFPVDEVGEVLGGFGSLAPLIIGEIPGKKEKRACGGEAKDRIIEIVEKLGVTTLGFSGSHLGHDAKRRIWAKKYLAPAIRTGLDGYFGVSHDNRRKFGLGYQPSTNEWILESNLEFRAIIRGLNVWNLLHFNIVWPPPSWWKTQARAAYGCLEFKSDVRPWNLLVTSTGLKAIDHTHRYPNGDQAEFKPGHLDRLDEIFSEMRPNPEYLTPW